MNTFTMKEELRKFTSNHKDFKLRKLSNSNDYSFKSHAGDICTGSIEKIYTYLKEIHFL